MTKRRDRASYVFVLVSVAAVIEHDNDTLTNVRACILAVLTDQPWRNTEVEKYLSAVAVKPIDFRAVDIKQLIHYNALHKFCQNNFAYEKHSKPRIRDKHIESFNRLKRFGQFVWNYVNDRLQAVTKGANSFQPTT